MVTARISRRVCAHGLTVSDGGGQQAPEFANGCRPLPFAGPKVSDLRHLVRPPPGELLRQAGACPREPMLCKRPRFVWRRCGCHQQLGGSAQAAQFPIPAGRSSDTRAGLGMSQRRSNEEGARCSLKEPRASPLKLGQRTPMRGPRIERQTHLGPEAFEDRTRSPRSYWCL